MVRPTKGVRSKFNEKNIMIHSILIGLLLVAISTIIWAFISYIFIPNEDYNLTMVFKQKKEIPNLKSKVGDYWVGKCISKQWYLIKYPKWYSLSCNNHQEGYYFTQEQINEYFELSE